jgi:hypothetical protein
MKPAARSAVQASLALASALLRLFAFWMTATGAGSLARS